MALAFPPECDTPLDRFTFLRRVHRRLILRHAQVRTNNLPARPTPEQLAAFKAWERGTWLPRLKRCAVLLGQYRAALLAALTDDQLYAVKQQQQTDTTWDYAIDPDQV